MAVPNSEWRFPERLAKSGTLARLWNSNGLERGNGIAISLLPILVLHVCPKEELTWTGWRRIRYRDFAKLAGVGHNSVGHALARLRGEELLQKKTRSRVNGELTYLLSKKSKRIVWYRLNAKKVYAHQDEPYVSLPAEVFLGGSWARLPAASRALYLVYRGLSGRQERPSLGDLETLSGLPRSTLDRALKVLRKATRKTLVEPRPRGRPRKAEIISLNRYSPKGENSQEQQRKLEA